MADRQTSPGRLLRGVAGVQEAVLSAVPAERARYTALGGLVVGAAMLSVVSMAVALQWVGLSAGIAIPLAVVWGLLVLTLDRWLISSVSGTVGTRERLISFAPRVLLAVMTGAIIAEPLVLKVFDNEIQQQIRTDQAIESQVAESRLRYCNPIPGTAEAAADPGSSPACQEFRLVLSDPGTDLAALESLQAQRQALQGQLNTDTANLTRLEALARQECDGTAGAGLTGKAGLGPNCQRLRAEADRFRNGRIDPASRILVTLNQAIAGKTTQLSSAQNRAAAQRDRAIQQAISDSRTHSAAFGVLARMSALQQLSDANHTVGVATWLLRFFLILIDTLPALARLLMGTTAYDRIIALQSEQAVRTQFEVAQNRHFLALKDEEFARARKELEIATLRDRIELEASIDRLLVDSRRASLITRRATELRGEGGPSLVEEIGAADGPQPDQQANA